MSYTLTQVDTLLSQKPQRPYLRKAPFDQIPKKVNPVDMFKGKPPGIPELMAGWGVERPLSVNGESMTLNQLAQALLDSVNGTFFLVAPPGSGKKTLLRQLAVVYTRSAVYEDVLVLKWRQFDTAEEALIADLQDGGKRVVVIAELDWTVDHLVLEKLRSSLEDRVCPVLLTATPQRVRGLYSYGNRISFGPLQEEHIDEILEQLTQVRKLAEDQLGGNRLRKELPNLAAFVAKPDRTLFEAKPLPLAILEAVYGSDYRDRLATEYHNLQDSQAQRLYALICFVHATGPRLPTAYVQSLGGEDVSEDIYDRYAEGDPWELQHLNGEERLGARSSVVAQVLIRRITRGLRSEQFEAFMNLLVQCAAQRSRGKTIVDQTMFARDVLMGYAEWSPVDERRQKVGKELTNARRAIRNALYDNEDELTRLWKWIESDDQELWGVGLSWGSRLYHSLPTDVSLSIAAYNDVGSKVESTKVRFVVESNIECIEKTRRAAVNASVYDEQSSVFDYLSLKGKFLEHQIKGNLRDDELDGGAREWLKLIEDGDSLRTEAYVDTASVQHRRAKAAYDRGNPEAVYEFAKATVTAYEYLWKYSGENLELSTRYASFLNDAALWFQGEGERYYQLLKHGWDLSEELEHPNPRSGTYLASWLLRHREDARKEATSILKRILEDRRWGEALFDYCSVVAAEGYPRDHVRFLKRYLNNNPPAEWPVGINAGFAWHAQAIILQDRGGDGARDPDVLESLQAACSEYKRAFDLNVRSIYWMEQGDVWKDAAERLADLDQQKGTEALQECEAAVAEYEQYGDKKYRISTFA